jgi:sulfatase modifying factor 1
VRSGSPGAYSYSPEPVLENTPVNYLSALSALRFANWMSNGQGSGDTETGSYTFTGTPSDGAARNPGATIVLASENEWYKAAYYDAVSASYFDYPTSSNTQPLCTWRPSERVGPNAANCGQIHAPLLPVGTYIASASPYGTFDQGGNAWEWTDTLTFGCPAPFDCQSLNRVLRGGAAGDDVFHLSVESRNFGYPIAYIGGLRLVMVPEPGTGLLVMLGVLGLARRPEQN